MNGASAANRRQERWAQKTAAFLRLRPAHGQLLPPVQQLVRPMAAGV